MTGSTAAEAELKAENVRLADRLELLSDVSRQVSSSLVLETVLQNIVNAACKLASARYGAMAVFDDSSRIKSFFTHGISPEERRRMGSEPVGRGVLALLKDAREPITLSDLTQHPRSLGFPPNHPMMRTFLGTPVRFRGRALGNIYLTEKEGGSDFTSEDASLLALFASHAALAINNASQYARELDLRKRAETDRARLMAIIDSSAAGIVVAEPPDGRIVTVNQEAKRLVGLGPGDADLDSRYHQAAVRRKPDGTEYVWDELPIQRAIQDGVKSHGAEVLFELKDGRKIPTLVNAAPVYDADGRLAAAVAVIEDITERREIEQLKTDFLSMVSHDLRGPLAAIKGVSSGLLMTGGSNGVDDILEDVSSIDEEVDRMSELVGNLLDMSRIEANSMPRDPEVCHLADIVSEGVRRVDTSREGAGREIIVDVPLDLPEIYADYDQIVRVLINLLSNALKYSPEGSPVLIRSYPSPNGGDAMVTEVVDHGMGIPDSEADKIFDKFFRVTSQMGRGRPGSGLGLAICKAIVEAHEGRIWVETEPGEGSTFYFSLPSAVASVGYD